MCPTVLSCLQCRFSIWLLIILCRGLFQMPWWFILHTESMMLSSRLWRRGSDHLLLDSWLFLSLKIALHISGYVFEGKAGKARHFMCILAYLSVFCPNFFWPPVNLFWPTYSKAIFCHIGLNESEKIIYSINRKKKQSFNRAHLLLRSSNMDFSRAINTVYSFKQIPRSYRVRDSEETTKA